MSKLSVYLDRPKRNLEGKSLLFGPATRYSQVYPDPYLDKKCARILGLGYSHEILIKLFVAKPIKKSFE